MWELDGKGADFMLVGQLGQLWDKFSIMSILGLKVLSVIWAFKNAS